MSRTRDGVETVRVELGERGYPIHIGAGVLGRGDLLRPHLRGRQVAIVSNEVVAPLYLETLRQAIGEGRQVDVFLMADGERHKNLETYGALMDFLLEHRHNRTTTLVALGGGVVGDLTGFAAATFQRGVDFVQVPTTLLAQVDSSVGGKTAVNHPRGKNMIGAFYQPRCVLADTTVFDTLPDREYRAGLAEVVKYGVIRDAAFFDWLETRAGALGARDAGALARAVRRSCEIKAEVVAADEREGGLRAILNYGHTFGHAIETLTGYERYLHGEAVAIGMVAVGQLAMIRGSWSADDMERQQQLIAQCGLPTAWPKLDPEAVLKTLQGDKKVLDGKLRFILPTAIGSVEIRDDITREEILRCLEQLAG